MGSKAELHSVHWISTVSFGSLNMDLGSYLPGFPCENNSFNLDWLALAFHPPAQYHLPVPVSSLQLYHGGSRSMACTGSMGSEDEEKRAENVRSIFYIGFK